MGAPERLLRWHYRSRHESLIAVSNRAFYDDRLIVFPSPDAERREAGLVLRPMTGADYDRGRSRTNPVEAEAVSTAVMALARAQLARPAEARLSLGVAAFSMAQREAIQDRLELLRSDEPACEPFFAPGGPEPFFVKNLETVQGDERDVIFISIGYGRTADGALAMGFGPLNGEGGERRLNVLITRARIRCEVFTSLTSGDLDLNRTGAAGVQALKLFLAYAEGQSLDGRAAASEAMPEARPEFEQAVAASLAAAGYTVRSRVGSGSATPAFDLAVVDRGQPGRYRLALACDGPDYHAARTARDRDRLRFQVLQSLGWTLRHVWSTDWIKNPDGELKRVLAALEEPAPPPKEPDPEPEPAPAAVASGDPPPDAVSVNGQDAEPAPAYERETEGAADPAPPVAVAYEVARLPEKLSGFDLSSVPTGRLASWVAEVVAVESPVHVDEVARRIAEAAGVKRLGSRMQAALDSACRDAARRGTIRRQGDFLWSPAMQQPVVRDRSDLPAASRKLDLIAPEEVAQAVEAVVAASFGIEADALPAAAGRALGFTRIGDEFRARVVSIVQSATESGRLALRGGQVVAATAKPGV
jgi:hypothetical protein